MTSVLNYKCCIPSTMAFFVRNRKFIQFLTWLKKNFQDWVKIDEDIDIFDEDMLTLSPPVSAIGVLTHSVFGGLKQFCNGFSGNFASLSLGSFPQFIKRLSLLSGIVCSLFESTRVVFDGVKENHSQRVHLLCNDSDAAVL